jgi:hypothetical protein
MSTVREHGTLFQAAMVLALLAGTKTQTRRLLSRRNTWFDGHTATQEMWERLDFASPRVFVDPGPSPAGNSGPYLKVPTRDGSAVHRIYPRVQIGDRFWVKETWQTDPAGEYGTVYRATQPDGIPQLPGHLWRPSIFMPRWASRLTLTITEVRIERLQDISVADARAEGISEYGHEFRNEPWFAGDDMYRNRSSVENYAVLWDFINGDVAPWSSNPWVLAYTFEVANREALR